MAPQFRVPQGCDGEEISEGSDDAEYDGKYGPNDRSRFAEQQLCCLIRVWSAHPARIKTDTTFLTSRRLVKHRTSQLTSGERILISAGRDGDVTW